MKIITKTGIVGTLWGMPPEYREVRALPRHSIRQQKRARAFRAVRAMKEQA